MLQETYNTFKTNKANQKLAELSEKAHKKAAKYLCFCIPLGEYNPPQMDTILSKGTFGRKELTATFACHTGTRLGKLPSI